MYKKMDKTECCKVKSSGYKLNIGVCEEMQRSKNGRKIVGKIEKCSKCHAPFLQLLTLRDH